MEQVPASRAMRRDTAYIIAVVVSGMAFIGASIAVGLSARAVAQSKHPVVPAGAVAAAVAGTLKPAGSGAAGVATQASISEKDFAIQGPTDSVAPGLIDLAVSNTGPSAHELLIFKTDAAPDQLPLQAGRVDETSDQMTKVFDSVDKIAPGTTKSFQAALVPGHYVLVCNLLNHYLAGMHTAFTVG
jgi:uncharacterized cupredoxin-like copper-binding protein